MTYGEQPAHTLTPMPHAHAGSRPVMFFHRARRINSGIKVIRRLSRRAKVSAANLGQSRVFIKHDQL
jgi:hypothetical protein